MCLAIPAKVITVIENNAEVQWGEEGKNIKRKVRLDLLEDVRVGDFVLVHGGFAIQKMDEEQAKETFEAWQGILDAE